jgi:hypothetical protein
MQYTRVKRREKGEGKPAGVYANLDELVRLQFKARGFSFLPKQPIHSLLAGRHASRLRGRGLNSKRSAVTFPATTSETWTGK